MRALVAGNWKMNGTRADARALAEAARETASGADVDVAVFPPAVYLEAVRGALGKTSVKLGAQNAHDAPSGAFTGETSLPMLVDLGVSMLLVGHSERRHVFGETDAFIRRKVDAALALGVCPVLCVGETGEERRQGLTATVLARQLTTALEGVEVLGRPLEIAYEPVWAIGTGVTATPEQAGEAHATVRDVLKGVQSRAWAEAVRVLYGGSVTAANARELMRTPGVDGLLVGGASLNPAAFRRIAEAAASAHVR